MFKILFSCGKITNLKFSRTCDVMDVCEHIYGFAGSGMP